jgi:hypothetical protein
MQVVCALVPLLKASALVAIVLPVRACQRCVECAWLPRLEVLELAAHAVS